MISTHQRLLDLGVDEHTATAVDAHLDGHDVVADDILAAIEQARDDGGRAAWEEANRDLQTLDDERARAVEDLDEAGEGRDQARDALREVLESLHDTLHASRYGGASHDDTLRALHHLYDTALSGMGDGALDLSPITPEVR